MWVCMCAARGLHLPMRMRARVCGWAGGRGGCGFMFLRTRASDEMQKPKILRHASELFNESRAVSILPLTARVGMIPPSPSPALLLPSHPHPHHHRDHPTTRPPIRPCPRSPEHTRAQAPFPIPSCNHVTLTYSHTPSLTQNSLPHKKAQTY